MENVILIIHLIIALCGIAVVLLQRSEGGGLGIGGGGGVVSSRGAATALGKMTWLFMVAFFITSISLTVIAARNSSSGSVVDRLGIEAPASGQADDLLPSGSDLLPPTPGNGPLAPPRAE